MIAKIKELVPGGRGIANLENGKKAFIWNALPGEEVEFETTKSKTHYEEGIATKIITTSPHRIAPKDECFLSTSPWQIIDYHEELIQKSKVVTDCFRQMHLDFTVQPTITDGRDFYYRNKMEYALYWSNEDDRIHLAFHARGTHRKNPITQSSIERPEIFAEASRIVDDSPKPPVSSTTLILNMPKLVPTNRYLYAATKPGTFHRPYSKITNHAPLWQH